MNEETHKSDESPNAVSLEHVQQRFECWRQRRKKRARIPQSLWKAAVALSREYSICHLSKALRVNYTALKNKSKNPKTQIPAHPIIFLPHSWNCRPHLSLLSNRPSK